MVEMIISGGQTGADSGGLVAAVKLGLKTGGWMPKGFRRLDGKKPEMKQAFNMKEHSEWGYAPRTEANVRDSDGTVRFASNFYSPGELCTMKAIKKLEKPYFDVDINDPRDYSELVEWLDENDIRILNVAGNSEQNSPGIKEFVIDYLVEALS